MTPADVIAGLRDAPDPTDADLADALDKFRALIDRGDVQDGQPVPSMLTWAELNALLLEGCIYDGGDRLIACLDSDVDVAAGASPAEDVDVWQPDASGDYSYRRDQISELDINDPHVFKCDNPERGTWRFSPFDAINYLRRTGWICDDESGTPYQWDGTVYRRMTIKKLDDAVYRAIDKSPHKVPVSARAVRDCTRNFQALMTASTLTTSDGRYTGRLIAFQNGWYNVDDDVFLPPSRNVFVTSQYNAVYDPRITSHPVEDVYRKVIPDGRTRQAWYEICGSVIFRGDGNAPSSIYILYGPGETGKSALGGTLADVIGYDLTSFADLRQLSTRFNASVIEGKLLNFCGEAGSKKDVADGELLKKIADKDWITVERKNVDAYQIKSDCDLLFASNGVPNFGDTSSGMRRRLVIIPCRQDMTRADMIWDDLRADDAKSWLINMALKAHHARAGGNFTISDEMQKEHSAFSKTSSPLYDFLCDYFSVDVLDKSFVRSRLDDAYSYSLYAVYEKYCARTNSAKLSSRQFNENIRNEFNLRTDYAYTYDEYGERVHTVQFHRP